MSKLKSDIIQKIYKEKYICKQGHPITWKGTEHVYSTELICDKCGKKSSVENPIRWNCAQCNTYFCNSCFNIIFDKVCPKKHKYKFYKQNLIDSFTYYTCDNCSEKLQNKDGVLFDKECNITVCPKCFCDSCDIPDVLED